MPVFIDSATIFGAGGVEIAKSLNNPFLLDQLYSDLGYAWMEKVELVNALENQQTALDLQSEIGDSAKIFETITNLGSEY